MIFKHQCRATLNCENANVFELELEGATPLPLATHQLVGRTPSTSYDIAEATVVTTLDISSETQVQALLLSRWHKYVYS